MENFLKCLKKVKNDHTCAVCSELCNNPRILNKCFHIICYKHLNEFSESFLCPTCKTSNSKKYARKDENMIKAIESIKGLEAICINSEAIEDHDNKEKRNSNNDIDKFKQLNVSTVSSSATLKSSKNIEKKNKKGETVLHVACVLGKLHTIMDLLKTHGANPNTKDNAGWTPLHEVVVKGRLDIAEILLQHGALSGTPGYENETPLHEAVRYNRKEIAILLVENGADILARNTKGETPIALANKELQEILFNVTAKSQSDNIHQISSMQMEIESSQMFVYTTMLSKKQIAKLNMLARVHKNIKIEQKLTKKVTHVIVDTEIDDVCLSGLDILQTVVYGAWLISSKWLETSTETTLESASKYEVSGIGNLNQTGPRKSRFNKYRQLPNLFDGLHFYLQGFNFKYEITKRLNVNKAILTKLITDAGGVVLRREPNPELIPENEKTIPYHARKDGKLAKCSHIILFKTVYEPMFNMEHLKALPVGWLIESIENFELAEIW